MVRTELDNFLNFALGAEGFSVKVLCLNKPTIGLRLNLWLGKLDKNVVFGCISGSSSHLYNFRYI